VEKKRKKRCRKGFWNVAGIGNKDEKFWKGLRRWDIIVMLETCMDRKGWIGKAAKGFYVRDVMGGKEK